MIVTLCKPILRLLRLADRDGAMMGLIYACIRDMSKAIDNMGQMIDIDPIKLDEIKICCTHKFSMIQSPLHATTFVLHPQWTANGQDINHELNSAWLATITSYANGIDALENALLDEFYVYREHASDMFCLPLAKDYDRVKYPIKWWKTFGTATPNLAKLAIRVLSQGTSASSCERNWSTFYLIHHQKKK